MLVEEDPVAVRDLLQAHDGVTSIYVEVINSFDHIRLGLDHQATVSVPMGVLLA